MMTNRPYAEFARAVAAARVAERWTQQVAAEMMGVPTSTYKQWEQGRVLPSMELADKLIELYDDGEIEDQYTAAKVQQLDKIREGRAAGQAGERSGA